jgi:hypothetical protein
VNPQRWSLTLRRTPTSDPGTLAPFYPAGDLLGIHRFTYARKRNCRSFHLYKRTQNGGIGAGNVVLSGNGAQLSNKGGTIALKDAAGAQVHAVSYSKADADQEDVCIRFNT